MPARSEHACRLLVGVHQEHVLDTVPPAVDVQEWIAEQRESNARDRGQAVHGDDRSGDQPRADPPAGKRGHEVEHEREHERGGDGPEAAREARAAVPAVPVGSEPGHAGEDGEQPEVPGAQLDPGQDARADQAEAGAQIGDARGGRGAGVGRQRRDGAARNRNDHCHDVRGHERDEGDVPCARTRGRGDSLHGAILSRRFALDIVASHDARRGHL